MPLGASLGKIFKEYPTLAISIPAGAVLAVITGIELFTIVRKSFRAETGHESEKKRFMGYRVRPFDSECSLTNLKAFLFASSPVLFEPKAIYKAYSPLDPKLPAVVQPAEPVPEQEPESMPIDLAAIALELKQASQRARTEVEMVDNGC